VLENESHVCPLEVVHVTDASGAHRSTDGVVRDRGRDLKDLVAGPPDPYTEIGVFTVDVELLVEEANFLQEAASNQDVAKIVDLKGLVGDVRVPPALSNPRVISW
jgi:hypothetical protein